MTPEKPHENMSMNGWPHIFSRRAKKIFLLFFLVPFVLPLSPAAVSAGAQSPVGMMDRVEAFTMKNGIRVLILRRPFSPTASFYIRFRAGAVEERNGKTGLAHLLEHMMFKGTTTIGGKNPAQERKLLRKIAKTGEALDREIAKGPAGDKQRGDELSKRLAGLQKEHRHWYLSNEIDRLYTEAGAVHINASTGQDMITYHVSLPANKAELWARIEADRLANYVLREFYQEREVVREERRQRIDADPDGLLYERFAAAAFLVHPYRRPVIGRPEDIESLNMKDVERFHRQAKAPHKMVITIVGDVKTSEMRRILEKYFGVLPPRPETASPIPKEPTATAERRITIPFDAGERLIMGFLKPPPPAREDYVFDVIASLLSRDRTSRFYRYLVEDKGLAESVQAVNGMPGSRYPNLFCVFASVRRPHRIEELVVAVEESLNQLAAEPVPEAELNKVKKQLQVDFIRRLNTNEGIAGQLSYFETLLGDYRYLIDYADRIAGVTPAEVRAAARNFFNRDRRTLAIMVKE